MAHLMNGMRRHNGAMRARSMTAALTLVIAVVGLLGNGMPRAHAEETHPLIAAIGRVFERSQSDDLKEYGLDNSTYAANGYNHSVKGCWLKKGEGKINTPTLEPGVEYAVIAGGDNTATKIKIRILNPGGQIRAATANDPVITESTEGNNMPGVVFKLSKRQGAGIHILLEDVDENAGKESAYVSFVLLRKEGGWDVPLESLKAAAAKLQKRLDKVREANHGSADLAYSWFSIHGGVIPKGGSSQNGHALATGNKYVLIVASDENTEALEVTLDGIMRAPTPEEQDDESPKVTFRRGPASQFAAQHRVANSQGDTALVLVAIVQIIGAG